ncbi:LamG domain-containing protein [bacterium]|nr:LamG domain-containing protein [bacterium]
MSTKFLSPGWRMPRNANQSKSTNYSLDFDGSQYISCGTDSVFELQVLSLSCWFKEVDTSNTGTRAFIANKNYSSDNGVALWIADGTDLVFQIAAQSDITSWTNSRVASFRTYAPIGTWNHAVCTYDGTDAKIYINGVLRNTWTPTQPYTVYYSPTYTELRLGNRADGTNTPFIGQLDGISIFDYALSQSQVTTLYGTGSAIGNPMALPSSPIAYYPLGTSAWNGQYLAENNAIGDYVFDFDGNDDYLGITSTDFKGSSGTVSYSFWVKPNTYSGNNFGYFLSNSSTRGGIAYSEGGTSIGTTAGQMYLYNMTNSGALTITSTFIDENVWNHIVVVFNTGNIVQFYKNGALSSTLTGITSFDATWDTIAVQRSPASGASNPLNGYLSNIAFWNVGLTSTQVETLYNYGSPIQTLANIPQSSNLKAWYKLDATEIYNSTSTEWSVDNNQNPSAYPSSLDFDGNTNYISTATLSSFITNNVSVSAWVNFTTLPSGLNGAFLGMNNSFEEGLNFCSVGGVIRFTIEGYDTNYVANTVTLVAGQWYHFCGTWDGSTIELFTNGASQGTFAYNGSISTSRVLEIGRVFNNGYNIDGKISNVAIWNTGLLGTEVETIYNNGTPLTDMSSFSSLVSWWKLNNTTTGIEDSKGSNNGTNINGATEYPGFVNSLAGDSTGMTQSNLTQSDLQTGAPYSKYAMNFDGTDRINLGLESDLNVGSASKCSTSLWFKKDDESTGCLWGYNYGDANGSGYYFWLNSGSLRIAVGKNGLTGSFGYYQIPSSDLPVGVWQNIVVIFNGTLASGDDRIKVYQNGNLTDGTYTDSSNFPTTLPDGNGASNRNVYLGQLQLGNGNFSYDLNGEISNVSIWNTALTTMQAREIYNEGLPSNLHNFSGTAPVAWWQLGENSSFNGSDWICADEIGSNNGESNGMGVDALTNGVGTTANGTSTGMSEGSLLGDAPYSTANAISSGMPVTARGTDVPPTP